MKINQQKNISSKFNKKQNKPIPLELLVDIFKLSSAPRDINNLFERERLEIALGLNKKITDKMVTYELFILYWRNHIKAMLTTSRIIYVLCEKKFGERETKLFVGIEAKQIHSRSELVQCFLRINERAEETLKRAAKRPLHVTGSSEEGSSSPKKKYNTTWLKRLEGDICPICLSVVSNKWARHCSTSHSDFVSSPYDNVFIGEEKVKTFVVSCVLALGGTNAYGQQLADIIVFADKNGFYKQGLTRLEKYLSESGKAEPLLVRENVVSVHYDGNGAPGVVVGNLCINKAMNMASNYGYGIVTVENCKDIGTAQFYTDILATNGMTGFVFSGDDGPLSVATIDKSFEFLNITPECRVILSCFAKISHKCFFAKSPNHECLLDDLTLSEDAIVITKQRKQAYQQKFDDMKGLCYLKENIAKMNEDAITRGIHPDNLLEALTGASVSGST